MAVREYIEARECWSMEELFEQTERLLKDKCVVTVKECTYGLNRGGTFLVTGTPNKELTEAAQT